MKFEHAVCAACGKLTGLDIPETERNRKSKISRGASVRRSVAMSKHDRNRNAAIGLVFAFAVVFALGLWNGSHHQQRWYAEQERRATVVEQTPDTDGFWAQHTGGNGTYQAICDDPPNYNQADLCQQWRSAQKAEEIAAYTLVSLLIGFGGLWGLWLTVSYTKQAAVSAGETLKATRRGNRIAVDTAKRQLRAYVTIAAFKVKRHRSGGPLEIEIKIQNAGQTPAYGFEMDHCLMFSRDPEGARIRFQEGYRRSKMEIGPGNHVEIPMVMAEPIAPDHWEAIKAGTYFAVIGFAARYRDAFGRRRLMVARGYLSFDSEGVPGVSATVRNNRSN